MDFKCDPIVLNEGLAISASLKDHDVVFEYSFNNKIHDREFFWDNGWIIKIGRGFDIYQKPDDWFSIGASDFEFRPCLETNVDVYRKASN
jgi:ATP-dependent Lon protease